MKRKETHNGWILQLTELSRAAEQHCRLHVPRQNPGRTKQLNNDKAR
jgi:hypothetical protein